jgi:putative ABC transport system permease protein
MLPYLRSDFPEIEQAIRIIDYADCLISFGDKSWVDGKFIFADPEIFAIFSFPFVAGDPQEALISPFSLVLTESAAEKYFGDQDAIGAILKVDNQYDFRVTGVIKDLPDHSHFRCNFLASFSSYKNVNSYMLENWEASGTYQYVLLPEQYDKEVLEAKFPAFLEKHRGPEFAAAVKLQLEPLTAIHLHSGKTRWDIATKGDIAYVYGFSAIALLVLLLACFNFMNLTTARSSLRVKEVGMRKVLGANRKELIVQFLGESFAFAGLGILFAVALVELALPLFNQLSGKALQADYRSNPPLILGMAGIMILVTILAGSYPASFISRYGPLAILKGTMTPDMLISLNRTNLNLRFRQLLVVLQFSVSIALMSCTLLIQQQLYFIRDAKLGFDKESTVVITNPWNDKMGQRYENFKNVILQNPQIRMASAADDVPPGNINNYTDARAIHQPENETKHFGLVAVDYEYLPTLGAEFIAGRNFSREYATDESNAVIVNESAVKELNPDSPVGMQLIGINNTSGPQTIIGVVKDMHYKSMHEAVEPAIFYAKPWHTAYIVVNIGTGNPTSILSYLQNQWGKIAPEWPFQYYFMDQEVDRLYRTEQRMATVIRLFTSLAIFVSALGLFGLITLATATRTKEIGIRKVLGASVSNLLSLLSKDFVKLVLLANLIAWPIAWYAMNRWLQDFAYRIDIGWWVFALAGGLALIIALLTVSAQAIKAALANPVEALRYE